MNVSFFPDNYFPLVQNQFHPGLVLFCSGLGAFEDIGRHLSAALMSLKIQLLT